MTLDAAMAAAAQAVEEQLDRLLPVYEDAEKRLYEAMRYSTLAGGKRLRPFLVLESAQLFNVARGCALRVAAAVEMIHCYSLVHDDLPAMDDSALRRGRATTHMQFDEATAILAGDGLLTRAFEVLADPASHGDANVRIELVAALAAAAGPAGMVGGQMFDLLAEHDRTLDIGAITRLQRMKTGELIAFSSVAGAILGKAPHAARAALAAYAHDLGLAFQIADDLLDVEGDAAEVGKDVGRDADAGKATFVSILGLERAREQAALLAEQAAYAHDLGLAFQIADDLLDVEGDAAEVGKDVGRDADAGKATFVSILGLERAREQAALLAEQAAGHLDMFADKAELLRQVARFVITRRR